MANLFSRVRAKGWGGDYRSGDGLRVVYSDTQGELIQPSRGKPQPPRPLDGEPLAFDATDDRRLAVADWLTSPENPYFTRAIANRVWANFFGVGLVEAVDDLRLTNPASNEELLAAAAKYLVEQQVRPEGADAGDSAIGDLSARQPAAARRTRPTSGSTRATTRKRLKAEVLLDAISQVTGVPTDFKAGTPDSRKPGAAIPEHQAGHPAARFATSIRTSSNAFGKPDRLITCECERSNEPSMTQVLHLYNGDTVNKKLAAAGSAAEKRRGRSRQRQDRRGAVSRRPLALAHRRREAAARRPN